MQDVRHPRLQLGDQRPGRDEVQLEVRVVALEQAVGDLGTITRLRPIFRM